MISSKQGLIKMTSEKIDSKYYIKVSDLMLPKPTKKITVFVTGWNEWLQIKSVETSI